jgi:hypothetical protein
LFFSGCLFTDFEDRLSQVACVGEPPGFCEELAVLEGTSDPCLEWTCHPNKGTCALMPLDADNDGLANESCAEAGEPVDCDDDPANPVAHLIGSSFSESCDGVDNDCDGAIDEGAYVPGAAVQASADASTGMFMVAAAGRRLDDPSRTEVGVFTSVDNKAEVLLSDFSTTEATLEPVKLTTMPSDPELHGIAATADAERYLIAGSILQPGGDELRVRFMTPSTLDSGASGVRQVANGLVTDLVMADDDAGIGLLAYLQRGEPGVGDHSCFGSVNQSTVWAATIDTTAPTPSFGISFPASFSNDLHAPAVATFEPGRFLISSVQNGNELQTAYWNVAGPSIGLEDYDTLLTEEVAGEVSLAVSPSGQIALAFREGCSPSPQHIRVHRYDWNGTELLDRGEIRVRSAGIGGSATSVEAPAIVYHPFAAAPGHVYGEWFLVWIENSTEVVGARLHMSGDVIETFPIFAPHKVVNDLALAPAPGPHGIAVAATAGVDPWETALIPLCQPAP